VVVTYKYQYLVPVPATVTSTIAIIKRSHHSMATTVLTSLILILYFSFSLKKILIDFDHWTHFDVLRVLLLLASTTSFCTW